MPRMEEEVLVLHDEDGFEIIINEDDYYDSNSITLAEYLEREQLELLMCKRDIEEGNCYKIDYYIKKINQLEKNINSNEFRDYIDKVILDNADKAVLMNKLDNMRNDITFIRSNTLSFLINRQRGEISDRIKNINEGIRDMNYEKIERYFEFTDFYEKLNELLLCTEGLEERVKIKELIEDLDKKISSREKILGFSSEFVITMKYIERLDAELTRKIMEREISNYNEEEKEKICKLKGEIIKLRNKINDNSVNNTYKAYFKRKVENLYNKILRKEEFVNSGFNAEFYTSKDIKDIKRDLEKYLQEFKERNNYFAVGSEASPIKDCERDLINFTEDIEEGIKAQGSSYSSWKPNADYLKNLVDSRKCLTKVMLNSESHTYNIKDVLSIIKFLDAKINTIEKRFIGLPIEKIEEYMRELKEIENKSIEYIESLEDIAKVRKKSREVKNHEILSNKKIEEFVGNKIYIMNKNFLNKKRLRQFMESLNNDYSYEYTIDFIQNLEEVYRKLQEVDKLLGKKAEENRASQSNDNSINTQEQTIENYKDEMLNLLGNIEVCLRNEDYAKIGENLKNIDHIRNVLISRFKREKHLRIHIDNIRRLYYSKLKTIEENFRAPMIYIQEIEDCKSSLEDIMQRNDDYELRIIKRRVNDLMDIIRTDDVSVIGGYRDYLFKELNKVYYIEADKDANNNEKEIELQIDAADAGGLEATNREVSDAMVNAIDIEEEIKSLEDMLENVERDLRNIRFNGYDTLKKVQERINKLAGINDEKFFDRMEKIKERCKENIKALKEKIQFEISLIENNIYNGYYGYRDLEYMVKNIEELEKDVKILVDNNDGLVKIGDSGQFNDLNKEIKDAVADSTKRIATLKEKLATLEHRDTEAIIQTEESNNTNNTIEKRNQSDKEDELSNLREMIDRIDTAIRNIEENLEVYYGDINRNSHIEKIRSELEDLDNKTYELVKIDVINQDDFEGLCEKIGNFDERIGEILEGFETLYVQETTVGMNGYNDYSNDYSRERIDRIISRIDVAIGKIERNLKENNIDYYGRGIGGMFEDIETIEHLTEEIDARKQFNDLDEDIENFYGRIKILQRRLEILFEQEQIIEEHSKKMDKLLQDIEEYAKNGEYAKIRENLNKLLKIKNAFEKTKTKYNEELQGKISEIVDDVNRGILRIEDILGARRISINNILDETEENIASQSNANSINGQETTVGMNEYYDYSIDTQEQTIENYKNEMLKLLENIENCLKNKDYAKIGKNLENIENINNKVNFMLDSFSDEQHTNIERIRSFYSNKLSTIEEEFGAPMVYIKAIEDYKRSLEKNDYEELIKIKERVYGFIKYIGDDADVNNDGYKNYLLEELNTVYTILEATNVELIDDKNFDITDELSNLWEMIDRIDTAIRDIEENLEAYYGDRDSHIEKIRSELEDLDDKRHKLVKIDVISQDDFNGDLYKKIDNFYGRIGEISKGFEILFEQEQQEKIIEIYRNELLENIKKCEENRNHEVIEECLNNLIDTREEIKTLGKNAYPKFQDKISEIIKYAKDEISRIEKILEGIEKESRASQSNDNSINAQETTVDIDMEDDVTIQPPSSEATTQLEESMYEYATFEDAKEALIEYNKQKSASIEKRDTDLKDLKETQRDIFRIIDVLNEKTDLGKIEEKINTVLQDLKNLEEKIAVLKTEAEKSQEDYAVCNNIANHMTVYTNIKNRLLAKIEYLGKGRVLGNKLKAIKDTTDFTKKEKEQNLKSAKQRKSTGLKIKVAFMEKLYESQITPKLNFNLKDSSIDIVKKFATTIKKYKESLQSLQGAIENSEGLSKFEKKEYIERIGDLLKSTGNLTTTIGDALERREQNRTAERITTPIPQSTAPASLSRGSRIDRGNTRMYKQFSVANGIANNSRSSSPSKNPEQTPGL